MSTDTNEQSPSQAVAPTRNDRSFFRQYRLWIPTTLVVLYLIALAANWMYLENQFGRQGRVMLTFVLTVALSFSVFGWFVLLSRVRYVPRIGLSILCIAVVAFGLMSVEKVDFTGDLFPLVTFKWSVSHDEKVELSRRDAMVTGMDAVNTEIGDRDFPGYRGADRSGVVANVRLQTDWSEHAPRELWRYPVGGGYAAFSIAGDAVVTIEQRRDSEVVACYRFDDGAELWNYSYSALFQEPMGGDGPRATPTISGGKVYSLGAIGDLVCLDAGSGEVLWHQQILKDAGAPNLTWAMSGSPLIVNDMVVVSPGGTAGTIAAFDTKTGEKVTTTGDDKSAYSSPQLVHLAGTDQIVLLDAFKLAGYATESLEELWSYPWKGPNGINVAQPLVVNENQILVSTGYDKGSALIEVKHQNGEWTASEVWTSRRLRCKFNSPVLHKGFIYGLDEGILVCIDPASGERLWKRGRYGHGQLLLVGDNLLICSEYGFVAAVQASSENYSELGRVEVLKERSGKCWNNPALARGRLFWRNHREMVCYELPVIDEIAAVPTQE